MSLHFHPDAPSPQPSPRGGEGGFLNPTVMIACLRGRVLTRKALLPQSQGDVERVWHERTIAECEAQIERLQGAAS